MQRVRKEEEERDYKTGFGYSFEAERTLFIGRRGGRAGT